MLNPMTSMCPYSEIGLPYSNWAFAKVFLSYQPEEIQGPSFPKRKIFIINCTISMTHYSDLTEHLFMKA